MTTANHYMTKSQYIAKLCELRKYWRHTRAEALLTGDTQLVGVAREHIAYLDSDISDLHRPAYLNKTRKAK